MADAGITFASAAEALRHAVEIIGGQAATARLVGVTQPSVSSWLKKGKPLPGEHVLVVEDATGISRHDLRPDLYPRPGTSPSGEGPQSLFERFGGIRAMADALALDVATIVRWQQDRLIPADHQHEVLKTALRLGYEVTAEDVMFPFPEDRAAL